MNKCGCPDRYGDISVQNWSWRHLDDDHWQRL